MQQDDGSTSMSSTVRRWRRLAGRHDVGWSETLLIALNIHGLRAGEGDRMRLQVRPPEAEVFMTVVEVDRPTSPFAIRDRDLCVDGTAVAEVIDANSDVDVSGYLRAGGTAATLHPVAAGAPSGDAVAAEYRRLLTELSAEPPNGHALAEVTLAAEDLTDEATVVEQLTGLRAAMTELGLTGARIGLLSPVVRSEAAFGRIAESVAPFTLFLTTEPATGRESDETVPQPDPANSRLPAVLAAARSAGHDTSFTYTVGVDPLDVMREYLLPLAEYTTVWPSLRMLQSSTPSVDAQHVAAPDDRLDFFLQARTMLERIFAPTGLIPQPWRNYRGLWYREHAGEPLPGPWI